MRLLATCLLVAASVSAQSPNRIAVDDFALSAPFSASLTNFDTSGSSVVHENFVRLTADIQHQRGRLFSAKPAPVGDAWEVELQLRVTGQADQFFGDGMAFWYTAKPLGEGTVFGSEDNFNGLAIFFDTYDNRDRRHMHRHPYISAMINDGSRSYHYDYNSFSSTEADVGCHAEFRRRFDTSQRTGVRITYNRRQLVVSISVTEEQWQPCFTRDNVDLPPNFHFGVSASTGDLSDNHDLLGMQVYKLPGSGEAADHVAADGTKAKEDDLDAPTEEEMESINSIVSDTKTVKLLQDQAKAHAAKLTAMHGRIETEMSALNSHIVAVISKLQAAENDMDRRVRQLEMVMDRQVERVVKQSASQSRSWVLPFVILVIILVGVATFFGMRFRTMLKKHTL